LRRWFATGAIAVVLLVSGAYFHARYRVTNALKEVPGKIGLEIQQSAQGFTISKSELWTLRTYPLQYSGQ
jgi:lipopolysaccharide export system protein LptA